MILEWEWLGFKFHIFGKHLLKNKFSHLCFLSQASSTNIFPLIWESRHCWFKTGNAKLTGVLGEALKWDRITCVSGGWWGCEILKGKKANSSSSCSYVPMLRCLAWKSASGFLMPRYHPHPCFLSTQGLNSYSLLFPLQTKPFPSTYNITYHSNSSTSSSPVPSLFLCSSL